MRQYGVFSKFPVNLYAINDKRASEIMDISSESAIKRGGLACVLCRGLLWWNAETLLLRLIAGAEGEHNSISETGSFEQKPVISTSETGRACRSAP